MFMLFLASYVEVCHRSDPRLSDCIKKNIEIIRPKFQNGIPELFVPNLKPLKISEIKLNTVNAFKAEFQNLSFDGMENLIVNDLELDFKKMIMRMVMTIPKLRCVGNYHIAGKLLVPLDGQGPMDSNYSKLI